MRNNLVHNQCSKDPQQKHSKQTGGFFEFSSQEGVALVLLDELQHLRSAEEGTSSCYCSNGQCWCKPNRLLRPHPWAPARAQLPSPWATAQTDNFSHPIHALWDPTSPQSPSPHSSNIKGWINPLDAAGFGFFQDSFCQILCNIYLQRALMLAAVLALLRCRMAAHAPNCTPGYNTKRKCSTKRREKEKTHIETKRKLSIAKQLKNKKNKSKTLGVFEMA